MTKVYYLLDLNYGSFEDRGTYQNLVTAKAQLKTFKEKGFEKAFLVKVTEERIKLDDERIVRVLEQCERFESHLTVKPNNKYRTTNTIMGAVTICDECIEIGQLCYTHSKQLAL